MKKFLIIAIMLTIMINLSGCGLFGSDKKEASPATPPIKQPSAVQEQPTPDKQQTQSQQAPPQQTQPSTATNNSQKTQGFTSTQKYRTTTDTSREIGHYSN
jgi:uncharacterized membrane protein